jgi:hypothetical protein
MSINEKTVKGIIDAKKKVAEGALTIWNSRLELLANAGNLRDILDAIESPIDLVAGNSDCNRNCGCTPNPTREWLGKELKK